MGPVEFESLQPGRAGPIDAREDEQQAATNAEAEAAESALFTSCWGGPFFLGGPYVEDPAVWALYFRFWGLGGAVGPLALQMRCLEQRPACILKGIPVDWGGTLLWSLPTKQNCERTSQPKFG